MTSACPCLLFANERAEKSFAQKLAPISAACCRNQKSTFLQTLISTALVATEVARPLILLSKGITSHQHAISSIPPYGLTLFRSILSWHDLSCCWLDQKCYLRNHQFFMFWDHMHVIPSSRFLTLWILRSWTLNLMDPSFLCHFS